MMLESIDKFS